jgi:phage terminase small subunit
MVNFNFLKPGKKKPGTSNKATPSKNPVKKPVKKQSKKKVYPVYHNPIDKPLTDKELLFIKYYPQLKFNGAKAAEKAGYSKESARSKASQLLTKVNVQEAIEKEKRAIMDRAKLTQDMVIQELRKIGFSDIKDYISIGPGGISIKNLKDIDTRALSSASTKMTATGFRNTEFKLHNKVQALELLGRYFGTWNESNKFEIDLKNFKVIFADIDFDKKEVKK